MNVLSDLHHSISDEQKTNDAYLGPHSVLWDLVPSKFAKKNKIHDAYLTKLAKWKIFNIVFLKKRAVFEDIFQRICTEQLLLVYAFV